MATNGKVIITCAVTGAIHTPTMTPYDLRRTVLEMVLPTPTGLQLPDFQRP